MTRGTSIAMKPGRSVTLRIEVSSDWHTGTGFGVPGGVDASVRRHPSTGLPYLSGTSLAGLIKDASRDIAAVLDNGDEGKPWMLLWARMFGELGKPGLVRFSSATQDAVAIASTGQRPGVRIDRDTGRAADDMLRFVEVAHDAVLTATVQLLEQDAHGRSVHWPEQAAEAATALLVIALGVVDRLGAKRHRGWGRCTMTLPECGEPLLWLGDLPTADSPTLSAPLRPILGSVPLTELRAYDLSLELLTPLIADAGTFGNVITTHDYVPGTTILAWIHRHLRMKMPNSDMVRNAVTGGLLLAENATPSPAAGAARGHAVPLSYLTHKQRRFDAPVVNRLVAEEPADVHKPLRSGYVSDTAVDSGYDFIEVAPVYSMHNSYDPRTGSTQDEGLFTVEAIPAGTFLRAQVLLDRALVAEVGEQWWNDLSTRLGSKNRAEYGAVTVGVAPLPIPELNVPVGTLTVWLTSDVIVRNAQLRPGGLDDLIAEFRRHGVGLSGPSGGWVSPRRKPYTAAMRTRRIDGWYGAAAKPRPSVIALKAGSCFRVLWDGTGVAELAQLLISGVGERRAEGFGRFLVNAEHLASSHITLRHTAQR